MGDVERYTREGTEAFWAGNLEGALTAYERAVAALPSGRERAAAVAYENLGLAYYNMGNYHEAMRAFLRALDGALSSRDQSLRFLAGSAACLQRFMDAIRFLAVYEAHFGSHPDGWTQGELRSRMDGHRQLRARHIAC